MEEKYYLLTFNEDHADEHDVPALACFTEEEYNNWLELPSGKLNENYNEQFQIYNEKAQKYDNFWKELRQKDFVNKPFNQYTKEEKEWYDTNKVDHISSWDHPKKVQSNIRAYLGNSSDGFEESYNNYYLMKEFVENKLVDVVEVDKSFYDYFNKANLSSLSLTNVFTINEY